jgi:hypothetical protein
MTDFIDRSNPKQTEELKYRTAFLSPQRQHDIRESFLSLISAARYTKRICSVSRKNDSIINLFFFVVRSRFGSRSKFEMVEVADDKASATPVVSSFPTTAPIVTSAVLKAQRKKLSKKNK